MSSNQPLSRGPGRPRAFDVDAVVGDAMEIFQTLGYAGTSLVDLIDGTGLTRGSLYKAFKDKRTLFLAALDRYTKAETDNLRATLATGSPIAAIRKALLLIALTSAEKKGRRGCLVVSSTTELTSKDEKVRQQISETFARIQDLLEEAIRRAQVAGEIRRGRDAKALSRFLLCTIEGMGVLGKTGRTEAEMREIVEIAMEALK